MEIQKRLIGIMVSNLRQRKRQLQIYDKYASEHIEIFTFIPSSIRWRKKKILGLHFHHNQYKLKWFPFPEVIYNRYFGPSLALCRRLEKTLGKEACFNHITRMNKRITYQFLKSSNLASNLPETLPYHSANLYKLLQKHSLIYVKPSIGSKGKGVYRIEQDETGQIRISHHYFAPIIITDRKKVLIRKIKQLTRKHPYIVQQGIPFIQYKDRSFDFRVLVQKNETGTWQVSNVISRIAYPGCFNTSMCETITPAIEILQALFPPDHAEELMQMLEILSLSAAISRECNAKYHLGELSVDFGVDDRGKLWMIETNGQPQKDIYGDLQDVHDVYRNPIEYAQFLLSAKSKSSSPIL